MPTPELISIAILGTTAGLMIGCIGIGGVILVPTLVFLLGIPIGMAIPAAMLSYILSGLVAMIVFAHSKSIRWDMVIWLCIGAGPAAVAGAWAVSIFNPLLLEACLGGGTLLSGINSLRKQKRIEAANTKVSNRILLGVGTVTGFVSALTGSGGPLVLVPVLISFDVGVLTTVGLSQAIQLPIAMAATAANLHYGKVDFTLGGILAASLSVGSFLGARLAHVAPREILRRIVSTLLISIGLFALANVGLRLVG